MSFTGFTLKDFQVEAINDPRKKLIYRTSTGSGKSIILIERLMAIIQSEERALVVCPKNVKPGWEAYAKTFSLPIDIITRDHIHKNKKHYRIVLVDECSDFGMPTSRRTKGLLASTKNSEYILMASATPISGNLWPLYTYHLIFGHDFGSKRFKQEFYTSFTKSMLKWGKMIEIEIPVPRKDQTTTDRVNRGMDKLCFTHYTKTGEEVHVTKNIGIAFRPLEENTGTNAIYHHETMSPEMIEAVDMEVETGTVIVCYRVTEIEFFMKRYSAPGIYGGGKYTKDYEDIEKYPVIIVQSDTAVGYELPYHSKMIFVSKSYRYDNYTQAIGRIKRIKNMKDNYYINLIPYYLDVPYKTVAHKVNESLNKKEDYDPISYNKNN